MELLNRFANNDIFFFKRVSLLLVTVLLANPIVLTIVFKNIFWSIVTVLLAVTIIQLLYSKDKTRPFVAWIVNILFVASIFLHAELVFNTLFHQYNIDNLYETKGTYYFNQPGLNKRFDDKEYSVDYRTNRQGFRIGIEDDADVEVSQADWLFLGDSYTQGAQVQYESLYTSLLYKVYPNKIIVNAGISGFGLPEEYNYYVNEGRKLKPKKVFLQICNFNDFMKVEERSASFSDYLMQYSNFARFLLYEFKFANPSELPLGRWTEPFYADDESNARYNIFYTDVSPEKKRDLIRFRVYLAKLNEAIREDGAELVVLQIPTKEQVYYKYFEEVVSSFKIDVRKLNMSLANDFLTTECREQGIRLVDLRDVFANSEQEVFFQFDEHLNEAGHRAIAQAISTFVDATQPESPKPQLLSKGNWGDRYPVVSDSGRVFYQSVRQDNTELFVADTLMNNSKRLTFNKVDELHPWPLTSLDKVIFTEGDQSSNATKVVMMNLDGSGREAVTATPNTFGSIPSYNDKTHALAYAEWTMHERNRSVTNSQIVILDLNSGRKTFVTSADCESWRPIFSPDGGDVYYISSRNNEYDIFRYNRREAKEYLVVASGYDEWDPAISAGGKYLAFAAKRNNNWDLFLLNLDSRKLMQLTNSTGDEWDPCFSPDNKFLYFAGTFGLRNGIFRIPLRF